MTASKLVSAAVASFLGALAVAPAAQGPPPSQPPLVLRSTYGADLYQFYCSGCHGATARGGTARSPDAPAPPDLTVLARLNHGAFPRDRVREVIRFGSTASKLVAHGTADMPVWGTVFRGLEPSADMVEIRIENLVQYLASLQESAEGH
jgi:mono/diheme cytochrome c family protein